MTPRPRPISRDAAAAAASLPPARRQLLPPPVQPPRTGAGRPPGAAVGRGGTVGGLSPPRPTLRGGAGRDRPPTTRAAPLPPALASDRPRPGDARPRPWRGPRDPGAGERPPTARPPGVVAPPAESTGRSTISSARWPPPVRGMPGLLDWEARGDSRIAGIGCGCAPLPASRPASRSPGVRRRARCAPSTCSCPTWRRAPLAASREALDRLFPCRTALERARGRDCRRCSWRPTRGVPAAWAACSRNCAPRAATCPCPPGS